MKKSFNKQGMNPSKAFQKANEKADEKLVKFSIELLNEYAPLEAGFFLRKSGCGLVITLDAINKAKKELNLERFVYDDYKEKALLYGFDPFYFDYSTKLEIIKINNTYRISLRDKFNTIIHQIIEKEH